MEVIPTLLSVLAGIVIIYILYVIISYVFFNEFAALTDLERASDELVIKADQLASGDNTGNYTYSIWLYVQDWNYNLHNKKNVITRGSNNNMAFRVYLGAETNNILVETRYFTASGDTDHATCQVDNFPLQSWVNLTVSQYGRSCDIYIDGKLVRTCVLPGTADPSTDDVTLTGARSGGYAAGFHGYTCKFRYFGEASNPQQAYNIYKDGPCATGGVGGYKLVFKVMKGSEAKYKLTI